MPFPSSALSHSVCALPHFRCPLRFQPKIILLTPQVVSFRPQAYLHSHTPHCSRLTCHMRCFQIGVQSLSKTSSLAPGVRQLRPVIYYMAFPSSALSHSVFALPQSPWPLRLQPKVVFLTPQILVSFFQPNCSLIRLITPATAATDVVSRSA